MQLLAVQLLSDLVDQPRDILVSLVLSNTVTLASLWSPSKNCIFWQNWQVQNSIFNRDIGLI